MNPVNDLSELIRQFVHHLLPLSHPRAEIELLYRMMRDYPERGGKRIRGQLTLMSALAYSSPNETLERVPGFEQPFPVTLARALPLASALELFQNWVLIHDDIEDESEERRGLPALHRIHGLALALNAGDALHVYMWQAVFHGPKAARAEFLETIHRTAEGQHMDLGWVVAQRWDVSPEDYLEMVRLKTAYYTVVTPLRLGMIAANLEPDPRFLEAGLALGAAFQIRDDVLNLTADAGAYGKEIAGDLLEGKRTLMLLWWLEQASASQREFFLKAMNKSRVSKSLEDMDQILEWLLSSGAPEHAMFVANLEAERGLAVLEEALRNAPNQSATRVILEQMRSLATRMH